MCVIIALALLFGGCAQTKIYVMGKELQEIRDMLPVDKPFIGETSDTGKGTRKDGESGHTDLFEVKITF
jgi:hypothetical protein